MSSSFHGAMRSGRSSFRIALVEHITVLISTQWARKGMDSSNALSHNLTIARYFAPHFSAMSSNAALAAFAFTHR